MPLRLELSEPDLLPLFLSVAVLVLVVHHLIRKRARRLTQAHTERPAE